MLGDNNYLDFDLQCVNGPLCYPLLNNSTDLRKKFIDNRIFAPIYWPECRGRINSGSFEEKIVNELLPVPCDQRYDENSMASIIRVANNSF
ncbi:hypothetical protein D3C77_716510 [compost metagenome]